MTTWLVGRIRFVAFFCAWLTAFAPLNASAVSIPPLVKNLGLWYDASNTGSITTAANPNVTTWNDLSGNGITLTQATSGNQPAYLISGINGLGTLKFLGAPNFMVGTLPAAPGNGATHTIFVVGSEITGSLGGTFVAYSGADANNQNSVVGAADGSNVGAAWWFGGWNQDNSPYVGGSNDGTAHIFTKIFNGSTLTGNYDGTGVLSTSTTYNLTDAHVYVGVQESSHFTQLTGQIGEIVIYNAALSQTNYQIVEGYLACKWALQSKLPAGHPYKSSCPTGTPTTFSPTISGLKAWYDASNTGSITLASNPLVTTWNDLSGHSINLTQATTAKQISFIPNGVNSLGTMQFFGSPNYMVGTLSAAPGNGATHTIFVVGSEVTGSLGGTFVGYSGADANNQNSVVGAADGSNTGAAWWFGGWNQDNSPYVGGSNDGSTHIFTKIFNGSTLTGNYDGTGVLSTSTTYNLTDAHIYIGVQEVNAITQLTGKISEILVYTAALTQTEYQYAEGYLACKWGLQSKLPAGHPYKSSCPSGTNALTLSVAVSPTGAQAPGVDLTYTTTYTNGGGIPNYAPVVTLPVPTNTYFKVGTAASNQSTTGLAAPTVSYSNNSGTTYVYSPSSAGGGAPSGYDGSVTNVRWTFTGALGCGSVNNSGTVTYTARVK